MPPPMILLLLLFILDFGERIAVVNPRLCIRSSYMQNETNGIQQIGWKHACDMTIALFICFSSCSLISESHRYDFIHQSLGIVGNGSFGSDFGEILVICCKEGLQLEGVDFTRKASVVVCCTTRC